MVAQFAQLIVLLQLVNFLISSRTIAPLAATFKFSSSSFLFSIMLI